MKRALIFAVVLMGGAYAFEEYSGKSIGLGKFVELGTGAFTGAFAGGYGMAVDAGRSIGGGAAGMAGAISGSMEAIGN